jgi:hypothetical protein
MWYKVLFRFTSGLLACPLPPSTPARPPEAARLPALCGLVVNAAIVVDEVGVIGGGGNFLLLRLFTHTFARAKNKDLHPGWENIA